MTKPISGPDPNPIKPAYAPPLGACDAHCHIFGPAAAFPYARERRYTQAFREKHYDFLRRYVELKTKIERAMHDGPG